MINNYYKTANRSYSSAKVLKDNNENFNACYLSGYALECYSKIIVQFAYSTTVSEIKKVFGHNIKKLQQELRYLLLDPTINNLINSRYILDLNEFCPTIVSGYNKWDPMKRYSDDEYFWNAETAEKYIEETEIIIRILTKLKLDGVI